MTTRRISVPRLPDELVAEVLLLLPVKNLMRFRCACKDWNSMIRSKQFVKQHLKRTAADSDSQRVFTSFSEFFSVNDREDEKVGALNCPVNLMSFGEDELDILWSSCNGLICLFYFDAADNDRFILWNPSTGELKEPSSKYSIDSSSSRTRAYGFGYDASADDYKIFRAFCEQKEETGALNAGTASSSGGRVKKFQVEVNSLKSNTWRRLEDYHSRTDSGVSDEGLYLNGSLHWLGHREGERGSVIVSFKLATESFEEVEEERRPRHDVWFCMSLFVLGGISSICAMYTTSGVYELWGMKKYGGKASWIKLINISHDRANPPFSFLLPICFTKSGEFLMNMDGFEVAMYNPRKRTFRYRFEDHRECKQMRLYVESLVSPNDVIGEARN